MNIDYNEILRKELFDDEINELSLNTMNEIQKEGLAKLILRLYSLGSPIARIEEITEIKFDGKLIELSDGSKWEVDNYDSSTSCLWNYFDKVLVYEDSMWKLDDMEKVGIVEFE